MIASNNPSKVQPTPILKWEDDGGAVAPATSICQQSSFINVDNAERAVSAIAGGALLLHGLLSRSVGNVVTALLGSGLLYRALSGHCPVYQALGVSTVGKLDSNSMNWCCSDSLCASPTVIQPKSDDLPKQSPGDTQVSSVADSDIK